MLSFEVDDQTPEDLAVATDRLRGVPGVLDVTATCLAGKKGRLTLRTEILARPEARQAAVQTCFAETSTLGVRVQSMTRASLARRVETVETGGGSVRVKQVRRPPDGHTTRKAEMDDVATAGRRSDREALRRSAEAPGKTES